MSSAQVEDVTESKASTISLNTTDTTTTQPVAQPSAQPLAQPLAQPSAQQSGITQTPISVSVHTFEEATKAICEYYNTVFQQLECIMPTQIVDGGVVDFVDREKDAQIATARVRFTNSSTVSNGTLYVEAKFASLAFTRQKHIIKMQMVESS